MIKFFNNILIFKQISKLNNFSKQLHFLIMQNVLNIRKNNLKLLYIIFLKNFGVIFFINFSKRFKSLMSTILLNVSIEQ